MADFDWGHFKVRINIIAAVESLYNAWATRKGMEYWFLRLSEYKNPNGELRKDNELAAKGDSYTWLWHGWSDETVEYGTILDCNRKGFF